MIKKSMTTEYLMKRFENVVKKIDSITGNEFLDKKAYELGEKYNIDDVELLMRFSQEVIEPRLHMGNKKYPFNQYGYAFMDSGYYAHYDDIAPKLNDLEENIVESEYLTLAHKFKLNAEIDNWEYFYDSCKRAVEIAKKYLPEMEIIAKKMSPEYEKLRASNKMKGRRVRARKNVHKCAVKVDVRKMF